VNRDDLARHRRAQPVFVLVRRSDRSERIDQREAAMAAVGKYVQRVAVAHHVGGQRLLAQSQPNPGASLASIASGACQAAAASSNPCGRTSRVTSH